MKTILNEAKLTIALFTCLIFKKIKNYIIDDWCNFRVSVKKIFWNNNKNCPSLNIGEHDIIHRTKIKVPTKRETLPIMIMKY